MKVLVDTNIIIDALASQKPFSHDAEKIFLLAAKEKIEAYISASSVTDIYYILRKYSSENMARRYILKLFQIFTVLKISETECITALEYPIPDYEDALQDVCASIARCDYILTREEAFLKCSSLAISPAGFLAKHDLQVSYPPIFGVMPLRPLVFPSPSAPSCQMRPGVMKVDLSLRWPYLPSGAVICTSADGAGAFGH